MIEDFFVRLAVDLSSVFILVRLIYYPNYKRVDFFFTFFIFNIIIFLITFSLNQVEMSLGAAFGLFAVFSMLRYRTESISMNDMTYLFLFIAIGMMAAIQRGTWGELLLLNATILAFTYALEKNFLLRKELSKTVMYENIEMIKPEHHHTLIEDLKKRTGLNIHRISINEIDFLKDRAVIQVYYYE